jgi:hypothetical protein
MGMTTMTVVTAATTAATTTMPAAATVGAAKAMAVTGMVGGTESNQIKAVAEELAAVVVAAVMVMATETATATEMVTMTASTKMPTPTLTLTMAHWQQQQGQHVREVHCSKRPHHRLGLPPPTTAATSALSVGDTNVPMKKGMRKESTIWELDKAVFVIVIE